MTYRLRAVWPLAIAAAAALSGTEALAQAKGDTAAEKRLDEAINKHYLATKFDKAEATLRKALKACKGSCSPAVRAKIYMYLGIVLHTGKNDAAGAKEAFVEARKAFPAIRLDEGLASEETKKIFEDADPKKSAAAAEPEAKEEKEEAAEEEPPLEPIPTEGETPGAAEADEPGAEAEAEVDLEPTAAATGFGSGGGQVVLGVERLFGYYSWQYSLATYDSPINNATVNGADHSGSNFAALGMAGTAPAPLGNNPFASPRLGFDIFVTKSISVGLGAGFAGSSLELAPFTFSTTTFAVGLRGGYSLELLSWLAVWPRLGFTVAGANTRTEQVDPDSGEVVADNKYSHSYQNLTLEVPLVILPADHLGITLGPVVDLGMAGTISELAGGPGAPPEVSAKSTLTNYGAAIGIFWYL